MTYEDFQRAMDEAKVENDKAINKANEEYDKAKSRIWEAYIGGGTGRRGLRSPEA